jgi:hypothetical protein
VEPDDLTLASRPPDEDTGRWDFVYEYPRYDAVWTVTVEARFPPAAPFGGSGGGYFWQARREREGRLYHVHDPQGFATRDEALESARQEIRRYERQHQH